MKINLTVFFILCICLCSCNRGQSKPQDIIDIHTHINFGTEANAFGDDKPATPEALLQQMQKNNIIQAGIITIAKKGNIKKTRSKNDKIIALTKKYPNQFFAIGSVHPLDGKLALEELKRLASQNVKFLKLHPNTQNFDVSRIEVNAVVNLAGELGITVLFDGYSPFDANQLGKFIKLALTNPKTNIIIAHLGGPMFHQLASIGILNKYSWYQRNMWFDISAALPMYINSPYKKQLIWIMKEIGIDRILFGSDFPIYSITEALDAFNKMDLTKEEQSKILSKNARELMGK